MSDFDKIVKKLGPDSINDWAGKVWSSSLSDIELPTEINPDNVAKTRKFSSFLMIFTIITYLCYVLKSDWLIKLQSRTELLEFQSYATI